tara:strand:+ start:423 stop:2342 length:1920 start_codon:yes stop_codon:yes gene_type:complete
MAVKNVIVKVGLKGARTSLSGLKSVSGGIKSLGTSAVSVTKKLGLLGVGLAGVSVKLAGDFQKNLLEITTLLKRDTGQSIEDFTKKNLKSLGAELTSVANTSGLALDSLAKAKYDIVSAGFSNASDSAEVLNQATMLAVGGVTTAAGAADILTSALNAFGAEADQAGEVSDTLFTTVRLGKTTVTELGASLGQVLPFAKSFNLSLKDVGSAMATLTAAGINTAESTTALKGAIVALESPSKGATKEMKKLGIEVKRNEDGTVDLIKTVEQFAGLDPEVFSKLVPNVRAQLALKTLVNNMVTLQKNTEAFEDTSDATETAFKKMTGGINTQLNILKNNVSTIMITIGNAIVEKLQPKIDAVNTEFQKLNEIGFDNLALAIKDNIPLILETLTDAFQEAFRLIELQAGLFGRIIMDKLLFRDNDELHKGLQEALNKSIEFSTQKISDDAEKMYNKIIEDAKIASDEQKALSEATAESEKKKEDIIVKANQGVNEAVKQNIIVTRLAEMADKDRFVTSLSGARSLIKSLLAEAIARMISKEMGKGIIGLITGSAGAIAVTGLFDKVIPQFANGGIVQGDPSKGDSVPAMLTAGELILNQAQQDNLANQMGNVTVNISAPLVDETVVDSIIPAIEKAQRMNLA